MLAKTLLALYSVAGLVSAQSTTSSKSPTCSVVVSPRYGAPVVAAGYKAQVVAKDLEEPRTILFDAQGRLLVLEQGKGVRALELKDEGGTCVNVASSAMILENTSVRVQSSEVSLWTG